MFNIIIAEHSGFCFGVKRAINLVDEIASEYKGEKIYTLGPIIHNPQTVRELEEKGVNVIEDVDDVKEGIVVLRTHGVPKEELNKLLSKKVKIIDATCPFVSKAQENVRELNEREYPIIIIGEKEHPEVIALKSQIETDVYVIENENDFEILKEIEGDKIGIVSQTTQNNEKFKQMVFTIFDYFKEIQVYNTICNATFLRQKSAIELAKKVDLMIVIGGYNSANTKRLYSLCKNILDKTYHIETEKNIDTSWFESNVKNIGIAAGASTPDWIIENVINFIKKIKED